MSPSQLDYICKNVISKSNDIHRFWGIRTSTRLYGGHEWTWGWHRSHTHTGEWHTCAYVGGGQGQGRNSWPACRKLPGGRWSEVASRRPSLLPQLLMGGGASGMSWVCRHQARKSSAVSQMRMRQGRQPGASFAKAFLCSQGSPGRAHHLQLSTLSASFTSSHPAGPQFCSSAFSCGWETGGLCPNLYCVNR